MNGQRGFAPQQQGQGQGATAPWQAISQGSEHANVQYDEAEKRAVQQYLLHRDAAFREFKKDYFTPWWDTGSAANTLYADAMGLHGAEGTARARGAFQTSPGYEFAMQQGLQGVDRGASARGFLGSGNAAMALHDYARGAADQEYGNWLANLSGVSTQGLAAAQGRQARQGARADIGMWGGEKLGAAHLWGGGQRGQSILDSSQLIGKLWQDSIEKEKDRQLQKQLATQSLIGGLLGQGLGMFFGGGRRGR